MVCTTLMRCQQHHVLFAVPSTFLTSVAVVHLSHIMFQQWENISQLPVY